MPALRGRHLACAQRSHDGPVRKEGNAVLAGASTTDRPGDAWTPWTPLVSVAQTADRWLETLGGRRWWAFWSALLATGVGMVGAGPPLNGYGDERSVIWRYDLHNRGPQLFDPGVPLDGQVGNLTFRVVPRLIGGALGLDRMWQFQTLQLLVGVVFLWAAARLFAEALGSRPLATLLVVATAATWTGASAWLEVRGLFDPFSYAFLALAMWVRRPVAVGSVALAATFCDERALIALPPVLAWHAFRPEAIETAVSPPAAGTGAASQGLRVFFRPATVAVAVAVAAHLAIRAWLKHRYGLQENHNRYPEDPLTQLRNYPNGLWGALEGLWIVVAAAVVTAWHGRRWVVVAVLVLAGVPSLLAGVSVVDISRSIGYVWPLAPLATLVLGRSGLSHRVLHRVVWFATALSLAWPVLYTAGDQTIDWNYPLPLVIVRFLTGGP